MAVPDDVGGRTSGRRPGRTGGGDKRIAVLISGRGSNLKALIDACRDGRISGRIVLVISNRPDAPGLDHARAHDIPHAVVDHCRFPDREGFERELAAVLDGYAPDLVVLAGFMRVLTPGFVAGFDGRMINIHPSLLPEFRGLDTHARALAAGAGIHGASVHFVTAELDGGPVVMQARVPVCPGDTPDSLAERVHAAEHRLYPTVVDLICSGRIHAAGDSVWFDGRPLQRPLLLEDTPETTTPCAGNI